MVSGKIVKPLWALTGYASNEFSHYYCRVSTFSSDSKSINFFSLLFISTASFFNWWTENSKREKNICNEIAAKFSRKPSRHLNFDYRIKSNQLWARLLIICISENNKNPFLKIKIIILTYFWILKPLQFERTNNWTYRCESKRVFWTR